MDELGDGKAPAPGETKQRTTYDRLMRVFAEADADTAMDILWQMLEGPAKAHAANPGKRDGVIRSLKTVVALITARFGGDLAAPIAELVQGLRDLDKGAVIPILRRNDIDGRATDIDARNDVKVIAIAAARRYKALHGCSYDKAYEEVAGWLSDFGFHPPQKSKGENAEREGSKGKKNKEKSDKHYTGKSIKGWYTDINATDDAKKATIKDPALRARLRGRLKAYSKTLKDHSEDKQLKAALEVFVKSV